MAEVLHGSARTTPRVRAELQRSQASTRALAARYGLNPKTVAKWRGRTTTADAPMGPSDPRRTVLTPVEEAMVVEFRRRTLLPLDDVLGCLRDTIPKLTRSALHRCLNAFRRSAYPPSLRFEAPLSYNEFADSGLMGGPEPLTIGRCSRPSPRPDLRLGEPHFALKCNRGRASSASSP